MGSTTHFNLVTPELTDAADITAYNDNLERIDQEFYKSSKIVVAESTDGIDYTATVEGIDELYAGLTLTIIPNMTSRNTIITLAVNGLDSKPIYHLASNGTSSSVPAPVSSWFSQNQPVDIRYTGSTWKTVSCRPHAQTLVGQVPIASGGTGAEDAATARTNLGITNVIPIVSGMSGDGETYYCGYVFDELKVGSTMIFVPQTQSSVAVVKLIVNGITAELYQGNSLTTGSDVTPSQNRWLIANTPIIVTYDGTLWKTTITCPSASDINGTISIAHGGTGAETKEAARKNLGITNVIPIVSGTSGDGETYACGTVFDELEVGSTMVFTPSMDCTGASVYLTVNGETKPLYRASSYASYAVKQTLTNWLKANAPIIVTYNGTYWRTVETSPHADDMIGTLSINKGGTGATTAAQARKNLGIFTTAPTLNSAKTLSSSGYYVGYMTLNSVQWSLGTFYWTGNSTLYVPIAPSYGLYSGDRAILCRLEISSSGVMTVCKINDYDDTISDITTDCAIYLTKLN